MSLHVSMKRKEKGKTEKLHTLHAELHTELHTLHTELHILHTAEGKGGRGWWFGCGAVSLGLPFFHLQLFIGLLVA